MYKVNCSNYMNIIIIKLNLILSSSHLSSSRICSTSFSTLFFLCSNNSLFPFGSCRERERRRRRGGSGELTGGVDGRYRRNPKTPKHLCPFSGETQKPQNIFAPTIIVGSTGARQLIAKEEKKKCRWVYWN
jgi:hypothetical protein